MKYRVAAFLCCLLALTILAVGVSAETVYEAKTYTAKAGISELTIDVRDRKIVLEPSPDGLIHLAYAVSDKEFYQISEEERALTVTCADEKTWRDYIGRKPPQEERTITVQLPEDALASLRLSTTNEDLAVPSLQVSGSVDLYVNNGDIELALLDAGQSVRLEAKNGDIRGTLAGHVADYSVESRVKKGENNLPARLQAGDRSLCAAVNNGDIALDFAADAAALTS